MERLNPNHLIQTAPPRVRDAANRILEIGDECIVITPKTLMRVASITPVIERPGVPPGMMQVVLVTRLAILVPRDSGVEDLYFTRHQAEIGDGAIKLDLPPDDLDERPEPRHEAHE